MMSYWRQFFFIHILSWIIKLQRGWVILRTHLWMRRNIWSNSVESCHEVAQKYRKWNIENVNYIMLKLNCQRIWRRKKFRRMKTIMIFKENIKKWWVNIYKQKHGQGFSQPRLLKNEKENVGDKIKKIDKKR